MEGEGREGRDHWGDRGWDRMGSDGMGWFFFLGDNLHRICSEDYFSYDISFPPSAPSTPLHAFVLPTR